MMNMDSTNRRAGRPALPDSLPRALMLGLVLLCTLMAGGMAQAATFVVTKSADTADGTCDADCSLREAVTEANSSSGADLINFNIPTSDSGYTVGTGVWKISPATVLPTIEGTNGAATTINGYTQSGASANTLAIGSDAVIKIEVSGTGTSGINGLTISAANCVVQGLSIINCNYGVDLTGTGATGNKLSGNFIGTRADGTTASANDRGVYIQNDAPGNIIGGVTAAERNVISGNRLGISMDGANSTGNIVRGNYIGTSADGSTALPNSTGILIGAPNTTIGGSTEAKRNVISGNDYGIEIVFSFATGNIVRGNYIGTKVDGSTALPNGFGVYIYEAAGNTIGGGAAADRNVISGNTEGGVYIRGDLAIGNSVRGNSISSNGTTASALGIDLIGGSEANSVTANDLGDGDTGSNNLQNYPVLTSLAGSGGNSTIGGTLNSSATRTYAIDFYSSPVAHASGYGEGKTHIGSTTVTTNSSDNASFSQLLTGVTVAPGQYITATATRTSATDVSGTLGDTSEFSLAVSIETPSLVVTTTADNSTIYDGLTSLREAITYANSNAGADIISFNIPTSDSGYTVGTGVWKISPATVLPAIEGTNGAATTINGYTQPGASANTLAIGSNAVIKIELSGTGTSGINGLTISAANCVVQGLSIINFDYGVELTGSGATGNKLSGNFIGIRADGETALANDRGIVIFNGASDNTIGGVTAPARNVISGNRLGITNYSFGLVGNIVQGNYLGTNANGTSALANQSAISIGDANNTIGGSTTAERNVISGNGRGIEIAYSGATGNIVRGNYIGPRADGSGTLSGSIGVHIFDAPGNTIGGAAAADRNVISGNTDGGVFIGGDAATGNSVRGNSISSNGTAASTLGIDLNGGSETNSVTANDLGDGDAGSNNLQNYPVLTGLASSGGNSTIGGTLNSSATRSYVIDFYSSPDAHASGYGEGKTHIGSTTVTTNASGNASFSQLLTGVTLAPGQYITATATRTSATDVTGSLGDTSEFSLAVTIETPSLVVTTTADNSTNIDGLTSLREAVTYANSTTTDSTITFSVTGTITLTSGLPTIATYAVGGALTITGPGASSLTVKGATKTFNLFNVGSNTFLTVNDLTLNNSNWAISNGTGNVNLNRCVLSGNDLGVYIDGNGNLNATDCSFLGNTTGGVNGNSANSANITNCTFNGFITAGTRSSYGIRINSRANVTQSTFFGNTTGIISNPTGGAASVTQSTLSGNITGLSNAVSGIVTFNNTLVVGNTTNMTGTVPPGSNNLFTGTAAAAGLETTDGVNAVVLKGNGGPTETIALKTNGGAFNGGPLTSSLTTDQRGAGYPRVMFGRVDIGAFERQTNATPVAIVDAYAAAEDTTLTVNAATGVLANDSDVDGDTLQAVLVSGPAGGGLTLNADGSFTYIPVANAAGPVTFTYKANDRIVDSSPVTVTINIAPVNDLPTISAIGDLTIGQSTNTGALTFTIADLETADTSLTLGKASDDTLLAPLNGIVFGGTDGNRTVTVTPNTTQSGDATITITVSDGNGGTASESFVLTVIAKPIINVVNPYAGGVGTTVGISGTNFGVAGGITSVKFNGITANFTISGSLITATVPAGNVNGPITVTTAGGTATSAQNFTLVPTPTINTFSPSEGGYGTLVSFAGNNLNGATEVRLNGTLCPGFTVVNNSLIRFTVPTGTLPGKITVLTPGGLATSANNFLVYPPPEILSVSPLTGNIGATVSISGNHLSSVQTVRIGNAITSTFIAVNNNLIRFAVPAGAVSSKITVTTKGGVDVSTDTFTVILKPVISAFSPSSAAPGTLISFSGNNLSGVQVSFNGVPATTTQVSAFQVRAVVPAGATTGKVSATNSAGDVGYSNTDFIVLQPPTISSLSVITGKVGTGVVISGANFSNVSSVKFNTTAATFVIDNSGQITTSVPTGATNGKITVTSPYGSAISIDTFTITLGTAAPVVTGFSPNSGAPGSTVVVNGTGFLGATLVQFTGANSTWLNANFRVDNAQKITATVPAGVVTGVVRVTTAGGTGVSAGSFTIVKYPVIYSFSPSSGPSGTGVTLTGANFTGTSAVTFTTPTGTASAGFSLLSPTSIRCNVPNAAITGKIRVTNAFGTGITDTDFLVAPKITSFTPATGPVGTLVTINGTAFTGTTAVQFNGVLAEFTVVSATRITAAVPVGATTGVITVNTPGGIGNSATNYTVTP